MGLKTHAEIKADIFNKYKRVFVKKDDKTKKITKKSLTESVAEIYIVNNRSAEDLIKTADVSVNGVVVLDVNYELKSGDYIRVGEGHLLVDSGYTAIVE